MITTAMVGCGYWGPNLLRNFQASPDCEVKWACDVDRERLEHMQELYPSIAITTSFDTVLDDDSVDAVAIAAPVRFHFDMAQRCLLAGKHVFVEKPMASTSAECAELIQLADDRNLTLMVGHTFVYSSAVAQAKAIIDTGELGPIRYISARRLNLGLFQKDINVAWDLAPHDISIMTHLLGQRPVSVNCTGKAHLTEGIEDVTSISIEFDGGGFGMIHSSWIDPNKVREMTIVGDDKMLVYNDLAGQEKIRVYDKRVERPHHFDDFAQFQYSYHYGDMYAPYFSEVEPLRAECQHFADCIKSGDSPHSCGVAGLRVVEVLEAASISLANDGVKVDIADIRLPFAT